MRAKVTVKTSYTARSAEEHGVKVGLTAGQVLEVVGITPEYQILCEVVTENGVKEFVVLQPWEIEDGEKFLNEKMEHNQRFVLSTMIGATITGIRQATAQELACDDWEHFEGQVTVIETDSGVIYAAQDPEKNGPGQMFWYFDVYDEYVHVKEPITENLTDG